MASIPPALHSNTLLHIFSTVDENGSIRFLRSQDFEITREPTYTCENSEIIKYFNC